MADALQVQLRRQLPGSMSLMTHSRLTPPQSRQWKSFPHLWVSPFQQLLMLPPQHVLGLLLHHPLHPLPRHLPCHLPHPSRSLFSSSQKHPHTLDVPRLGHQVRLGWAFPPLPPPPPPLPKSNLDLTTYALLQLYKAVLWHACCTSTASLSFWRCCADQI